MSARAGLMLVLLVLAGCTATAPIEPLAEAKRLKPLPSYAADPFVPINLYVNANEPSPESLAPLVQYAADRLRDSGAFVRVDQGVQRWPITLQTRYQVQEYAGEGDTARRVMRWLTLGLLPVRTSQVHTLSAEVLAEPNSVATLELSVTVQDETSAYEEDPGRAGRVAVDTLLERLLAEIAQRNLIPRWAVFKPQPAKPPTTVRPVRYRT